MSKKYKNKTCIYCGGLGVSTTRDHVLARKFVLKRHRANLPVVPACKKCNNDKSKLETDLMSILPFGGRHADAAETLSTMVPQRLRANHVLRSRIGRRLEPQWLPAPSGIIQKTVTVPVDTKQIETWISLLTLGLIWHHWGVIVAGKTIVEPILLTGEGEGYMAQAFKRKAARHVPRTSIGGDALIYEGAMAVGNPLVSVWRFVIYGGASLSGDDPRVRATTFYVPVMSDTKSTLPQGPTQQQVD